MIGLEKTVRVTNQPQGGSGAAAFPGRAVDMAAERGEFDLSLKGTKPPTLSRSSTSDTPPNVPDRLNEFFQAELTKEQNKERRSEKLAGGGFDGLRQWWHENDKLNEIRSRNKDELFSYLSEISESKRDQRVADLERQIDAPGFFGTLSDYASNLSILNPPRIPHGTPDNLARSDYQDDLDDVVDEIAEGD